MPAVVAPRAARAPPTRALAVTRNFGSASRRNVIRVLLAAVLVAALPGRASPARHPGAARTDPVRGAAPGHSGASWQWLFVLPPSSPVVRFPLSNSPPARAPRNQPRRGGAHSRGCGLTYCPSSPLPNAQSSRTQFRRAQAPCPRPPRGASPRPRPRPRAAPSSRAALHGPTMPGLSSAPSSASKICSWRACPSLLKRRPRSSSRRMGGGREEEGEGTQAWTGLGVGASYSSPRPQAPRRQGRGLGRRLRRPQRPPRAPRARAGAAL
jgi:hypothetical protein